MEHERADVELARVPPVAFLGSLSNRVAPRLRARHEEDDGRQIVFEVPVVEGRAPDTSVRPLPVYWLKNSA